MAKPRSCSQQPASTDDLPEGGLPGLHMPHVIQQAEEPHLQHPTADHKQTSDSLKTASLETLNLPGTQKEKQQLGNENSTNLQLNIDSSNDKEVLKLFCNDRGKEKCDTLEIGDNKDINIQKINDSKCDTEVEKSTVENTNIYNNKKLSDDIDYNSTNLSNENKVNCDRNNNSKNKNIDISSDVTLNSRKSSHTSNSSADVTLNSRKSSDTSNCSGDVTLNSRKSSDTSNSSGDVTINNRKISDVVILINDEQVNEEKINSTSKNNKLKKTEKTIYSEYKLQPPLNKIHSVPVLRIVPPLSKVASAPNLRPTPNFTDYKNSYMQRHDSELSLKKDSPRENINIKKQHKKTVEVIKMFASNCCIFCGEGSQMEGSGLGQLITFCQCTASAHSSCLMGYVTFPSSSHDRCCVCRSKLQYTVIDKDTPMQIKYAIALVLIAMTYLALVILSLHLTQKLIPMGEIHEFLYLLLIGNVGFIPPAIIVFIITCLLNFKRPQPKLDESDGNRFTLAGISTWFGCNSEDCDDKSCGGDTCGVVLAAFCLLSVMVVLITASIYICYNVYLFYKSFKLRSKKSIRFQFEKKNKNTSPV